MVADVETKSNMVAAAIMNFEKSLPFQRSPSNVAIL